MSQPSTSTPISDMKKREASSPADADSLDLKRTKPMNLSGTFDETALTQLPMESNNVANITLDTEGYTSIAAALKDTFRDEIKDMITSSLKTLVPAIIEGVVSGLTAQVDSLRAENETLKCENKELQTRVKKLEQSSDAAEQYSRRNCLRVTGVPETEKEDTDKIVLSICHKLKADLTLKEIDRSHRVGKPTEGGRSIIVKFATYRSRQVMFKARTKLKGAGLKGVFINEDLTRTRSNILYHARKLVKDEKLSGAWSSDGTILVKDLTEEEQVHRISDVAELSVFT